MRDIASAPFLAEAPLRRVLDVLNGAGEETRIVGGAVRNALMGLPVADVDLATTALPQETARRAEAAGLKAVPTGIAHGTVTVVCAGTPFEVTTLREDVETDGRHATVRFGRDWARDAQRRDFTMNALFATKNGEVIDLVAGLDDLAARRVRFIGVPEQRIREDYLRILRLFRFHAGYGSGPLDPAALSAAIRCRAGLRNLSRERVGAEMLKLLAAPRAPETVRLMGDTGLLAMVLGGLGHFEALDRLAGLETALDRTPDAILRLGVLAVRIVEDADRLLERLRLSKAAHRRLTGLAEASPRLLDETTTPAALYAFGAPGFVDRLLYRAALSPAHEADMAVLRRQVAAAAQWVSPAFPIRAETFIARGITPGPHLGATLAHARAAWVGAGFPEDADSIDTIVDDALVNAARLTRP